MDTLNEIIDELYNDFHHEIERDQDENYRKGFYAGALFSALTIRDELRKDEEYE